MRFAPSGLIFYFSVLLSISQAVAATQHLPETLQKQTRFLEAGPLELHPALISEETRYQRLVLSRDKQGWSLPVFRVESFKNTELQFFALAPHRAFTDRVMVAVEGPFRSAEEADGAVLATGPILFAEECSRSKSRCRVMLEKKGVYRVYTIPKSLWSDASPSPFEDGHTLFGRLLTVCHANCARPTMNWVELYTYLKAKDAQEFLVRAPVEIASKLQLSNEEKLTVIGKFTEYFAQFKEGVAKGRFPVLGPTTKLKKLQAVLKEAETHPKPKDAPVEGDLIDLLNDGNADRDRHPEGLSPNLRELSYGHYIDNSLSAIELKQSRQLAHILTALSELRSASRVTVKDSDGNIRELHRPEDVFEFLMKTGHYIETRDERTYANFLALRIGETRDGIFPPWLHTGLQINGREFQVPMGHSQHAWRIWGPKVRAKVAFYLGIGGTGFFPVVDSRPGWTGNRAHVVHSTLDEAGKELTLRSVQAATIYYKRNRKERATLPEDGYGLLGVCNDASAFVAYVASQGRLPVSAYPMLRASEEEIPVVINDKLKPILASLPKDVEIDLSGGVESEQGKAVLRRIIAMDPHDLDSPWYPDPLLKEQMKEAQSLVIQPEIQKKN